MENIEIEIKGVKGISQARIELPLESGIYCLVGNNGCGKSTLLLVLSQLTSKYRLNDLRLEDISTDTFIAFSYGKKQDQWCHSGTEWKCASGKASIRFNGMYEGSLFYGTRFSDSRIVDNLLQKNKISDGEIVDSDEYIKEKLSFILHGDRKHYQELKRIRNREIASRLNLGNTPYFNSINGKLISQYRMSSGECLLISLLHFVYNAIIRRSLPEGEKILVLIDEIELALHPIAVSRFLDLLKELQRNHGNLVIFLTSHSPEVIRKIDPKNMYMLRNRGGSLDLINPCFPSYAIRDVYKHDGFDYLLLVEDILAAHVVNKILHKNGFMESKLVHVVPVGGWRNVLQLHKDLLQHNVLGLGREIISVLDGDVTNEVGEEFKSIRKMFLPIKSVEKFIYEVVFEDENPEIKKILNDKYFTIQSIDDLVVEHNAKYKTTPENPDKKFYFRLQKNLDGRGITEQSFIHSLCDDIMAAIDFSKFEEGLRRLMTTPKLA